MNDLAAPITPVDSQAGQRLSIAVVAMGGQGGGVLADWLRDVAEKNHWLVQTTSVPGVAQRTGATIYYIELFNPGDQPDQEPVMALMPSSGDVDLVVAAEWMETGRAIMRGLVTPDKTTLVASTHRAYATIEKIVPGDGITDPSGVAAAAKAASKKLVAFDMAKVAEDNASVISASMLGAVAACGALPFATDTYEQAIKDGGVGVDNSLKAFAAAHAMAGEHVGEVRHPQEQISELPADFSGPLAQRIKDELPQAAWPFAFEGVRRCVDYLDGDYAGDYLDRLQRVAQVRKDADLLTELARWLALRMSYEDPIRVADFKVRGDRFGTIRTEVKAGAKQLVHQTEYLHPRVDEIADTLPAGWGQYLLDSPRLRAWVDRSFGKGRKLRTTSLSGFLTMYWLAGRSNWRRGSLRHGREMAQIDAWVDSVANYAKDNPSLAQAVTRLARLIKGYSDTHAHGMSLFTRLSGIAQGLVDSQDGGPILDRLIDAALADRTGKQLDELVAATARKPKDAKVPATA